MHNGTHTHTHIITAGLRPPDTRALGCIFFFRVEKHRQKESIKSLMFSLLIFIFIQGKINKSEFEWGWWLGWERGVGGQVVLLFLLMACLMMLAHRLVWGYLLRPVLGEMRLQKLFFKRLFHVCVSSLSPLGKKLAPLFQEEDHPQRALIGLVRKTDDACTHKTLVLASIVMSFGL